MKALRYNAFMSYCHADQLWAAWLHRSLESYSVPKRLAGRPGSHGTVPSRLSPIFRDREDLSSASDLSAKIQDALDGSESLIVICSPAAARSKWVNQEIRYFRSLGRKRIYCVIVGGDPQASDSEQACFPEALLECEDHHKVEPLAADVRKSADGKALAKLKLVAGLLGVGLDELRQREKQRKRKLQLVAGVAISIAVVLVISSIQSKVAEKGARMAQEATQVSAEIFLADFLEEMARLGDVADIETRKAFVELTSSYLTKFNPADLTIESRRQLGVALSHRGVILRDEGQLEDAMEIFRNARETLQLLVDESQRDEQAMFELSQVDYWIGQTHLDLGNMEQAGKWFRSYAEVSELLHNMDPDYAGWTMEACYAQSNLGNLESRITLSDPQLVLKYFLSALEFNEAAAEQNRVYENELADSHANLADAWLGVCDLEQALAHRLKNVELAYRDFSQNPINNKFKQVYAHSLSGLSRVQQMAGKVGLAMENLQQSIDLQTELVKEDPNNLNKRWSLLRKFAYHARYLEQSGNDSASWDLSQAIEKGMNELLALDQDLRIVNAIAHGMFLRDLAYRVYRKGETVLARRLLQQSIQQLTGIANRHPDNKGVFDELALSYFLYWTQNQSSLPDEMEAVWSEVLWESTNLQSCSDLDIASRQAVMSDNSDKARSYVSRLIEKGYHEPEFKRFCFDYGLCIEQGS
jgi:tetratricopeptide (TPR) repeat protein